MQMELVEVRWSAGPSSNVTAVLIRGGNLETEADTQCKDTVKVARLSYAATSEGMWSIAESCWKLGEVRKQSSLEPSEGGWLFRHFGFGLLEL